jgi:hypothetical protein
MIPAKNNDDETPLDVINTEEKKVFCKHTGILETYKVEYLGKNNYSLLTINY